jgi:uncharacterized repeat protein (TIGR02543 family)
MKYKSIAVALITVLLCMVSGSSIACTTPATEYVLNISSTEGGSVTEPGEGKFPYCQEQGESVNLVATPDAGYQFVNWTGDVDTIADVNDATTTMTMTDDYSITANFAVVYDLIISSTGGGSVIRPGEGTFAYGEGTVFELAAEADEGYQFNKWTGDVGTIDNINDMSTSITVNGDYSITANFEEMDEYELTISSIGGGAVTNPGEGIFTYGEGDTVNLVATPDVCYRFVNWTGDVGTVADINAANTTITMSNDYSITAKFVSLCE